MATSWWRVKGSLYIALGILGLLLFAVGIIIGVSYYVGWPYYEPANLPIFAALCTPTALVPGILFLFLGRKANRREKELIEFSSWVKTYRRISLAELARKLGKQEIEAEKVLIEVVDRGLVPGFIDRSTNEFILQAAVGQELFIETCPRCHGNLQRRYFQGETVRCPYCQSVISAPPPRPT
ncbi:MAG: hypothetical protein E6K11_10830 [Methanobacteriota archaeon]|nr:MAG: hypothetical protein E6K11_10830 [Euryarchaeota archaeon]